MELLKYGSGSVEGAPYDRSGAMAAPTLHGTPLSHFTRKIRILLAELGVAYDFVRARSVLATTPEAYGDNPLMRVPTLVQDGVMLIESDHIARQRFNPH